MLLTKELEQLISLLKSIITYQTRREVSNALKTLLGKMVETSSKFSISKGGYEIYPRPGFLVCKGNQILVAFSECSDSFEPHKVSSLGPNVRTH